MHLFQALYGRRPWVVPEDEESVVDFCRQNGKLRTLKKKELLHFGEEDSVYLIDDGLLATLPVLDGEYVYVCGLFGPRTVLGSVRAIRHRHGRMSIRAVAMSDARVYKIGIHEYLDFLEADTELLHRVTVNALEKSECQLEGLMINDVRRINQRLILLFEALLSSADVIDRKDRWGRLPWSLTVTDLASIVHAPRESVSRQISKWQREGRLQKENFELWIDLEALSSDMQGLAW